MMITRKIASRGASSMLAALLCVLAACDARNAFNVELPDGTEIDLEEGFAMNDGETYALTVNVRDRAGNPVDVDLSWRTSNAAIVTVTSEGVVNAHRPGEALITASAGSVTASTEVSVRAVPTQLVYVGGSNQQGPEYQPLAEELRVRVVDRHGSAVAGVPVEFVVTAGGGAAQPATTQTDATGYAETTWVVGATGDQQLASVARPPEHVQAIPDSMVVFSAVAVDPTPDPEPPPQPGDPAAVTDLQVVSATETSVTLRWTAVSDGASGAASYALRQGSPTMQWAVAYPTERTIGPSSVGSTISYTYTGLNAGTNYQFQLITYRGTLNQDAIFGPRSNIVSASTDEGETPPPPPPPTVATVTASPASHTFTALGAQQQVTATARDGSGNVVSGTQFSWSSTNTSVVSVDNMGRMTANAVGTAMIIVTAVCCGASDTVQANVQVDQEPPPPGSGSYPNRPTGLTLIGSFDGSVKESGGSAFGIGVFGGWDQDDSAPASQIAVVDDPSNPTGSGRSLRFTWDQQYNPRSGSATANSFGGEAYRELYIMTRIYLESGGWSGFGNKYFYIGAASGARRNTSSPTQFYNTRENGGRLRFVNQNFNTTELINSADGPPSGNNTSPLVTGRWLNIEYRLVAQSSSGAADGAIYVWVNGVLVGSNTSVRWVQSGDPVGFSGMEWYADCNTVTSRSYYRLGELYIAGRR